MRQHERAKMPGWNGPFYPQTVKRLAIVLRTTPRETLVNGKAFDAAAGVATRYVECRRGQSNDGYWWQWVVEFATCENGDGKVLVAIPYQRDHDCQDGSWMDRAPAVYIQGRADVHDAAAAASRVARALSL